jgi:hypothetical protein
MVKCVCGKEISTVPDWLRDVKVQFVCNNCPNREVQGITQVDFTGGKAAEEEPARPSDSKKADMDEVEDVDEDEDLESEGDEP